MSQHHLSQQPVIGQPDDVSHPAQSAGPTTNHLTCGGGWPAAKPMEVPILTVISSSSSSAAVRSSTSSMHQNTPSDELTTPVHMHTAGSTARTGRPFTPEPAGRTGLREAPAALASAPVELLGNLPAPVSIRIMVRTTHTPKLAGWQAAQLERQQVVKQKGAAYGW